MQTHLRASATHTKQGHVLSAAPFRCIARRGERCSVGVCQAEGVARRQLMQAGFCLTLLGELRPSLSYAAEALPVDWLKQDVRRPLHVVYRVGYLQAHIDYYSQLFGMKVLRQRDIPEEQYSNAFLGFGPETKNFSVELTYNYGTTSYDIGDGFGYFGLAVPDVAATVKKVQAAGGKLLQPPKPDVTGKKSEKERIVALVEDPTGYKWQLIQKPSVQEPLCEVMLYVSDLRRSISWYQSVMGMQLLCEYPGEAAGGAGEARAWLGYGKEDDTFVVELRQSSGGGGVIGKGDGYAQVAISTRDVYKTAKQITDAGGLVTREPGPVPGIGTKIVATSDPDGWRYVFVDEEDFLKELK